MNAISSFRPLGEDAQWDKNQLAAKASWNGVFSSIYYLNADEPRLDTDATWFVGGDIHPTIKEMCGVASLLEDWSCLINADIVVNQHLLVAWSVAKQRGAKALVSYRWQPHNGGWAVIDNGLDFFAATPDLWERANRACPMQLRIGHPTWDTWMIGFFNQQARDRFFNITDFRCIFHPKHEGRRHVLDVGGGLEGCAMHCGMPRKLK